MKVDARTRAKLVEIGAMIRAAREHAGVSQAVLAERIGMFRENYLRIEKGRLNLTIETLMRIGVGLGLDLSVAYSAAPATPSSTKRRVAPTNKRKRPPRRAAPKQRSETR